MKTLLERFETMFEAAAFAEEGEHRTARQLLRESERDEATGPVATKRPFIRASSAGSENDRERPGKISVLTAGLKALEKDLTAAAFAEAGEFETAREMRKGERRVLLVLEGHPTDRQALQYALSFCTRMDSSLEILGDAKRAAEVKALASEVEREHIGCRVTLAEGNFRSAAAELAKANTHIDYVIVNSQWMTEKSSRREPTNLSDLQRAFSCPLIVVGS